MARDLSGPWLCPPVDVLDNPLLAVMKTASFGADRRIGAAWVASRQEDRDEGKPLWGGNAVFRELVQLDDGTLGTCFPAEMTPVGGEPHAFPFTPLTSGSCCVPGAGGLPTVSVRAMYGQEAGMFTGLPRNYALRCWVRPRPGSARFSLGLRGEGTLARQYELAFVPARQKVWLAQETLEGAAGLEQPFTLEVIVKDDLVDACVNHSRCIINRLTELRGDRLFFACENGAVDFDQVEICPL
jgi:beta-fructofuranosidase